MQVPIDSIKPPAKETDKSPHLRIVMSVWGKEEFKWDSPNLNTFNFQIRKAIHTEKELNDFLARAKTLCDSWNDYADIETQHITDIALFMNGKHISIKSDIKEWEDVWNAYQQAIVNYQSKESSD